MPNVEWEVAHALVTPQGTVDLNVTDAATGYRYQILPEGYDIGPTSLRGTDDNRSQNDGAILHPRFKTGLVATMSVRYQVNEDRSGVLPDYVPACGADARLMHEALIKALDSTRILTPFTQRLYWTPTGYGDLRLLDDIQCITWPTPNFSDDEIVVTFAIETPFPYAVDFTQQDTNVTSVTVITNPGNTPFIPVLKVNGPATAFTIINSDDVDQYGNPRQVVFDGSLYGYSIPGGQYAELDFFRGTIFMNGTGADLTGGLDPTQTDFFRLLPGPNTITVAGPSSVDILWNPSWG